jgi:hypothetical protein
MMSEKIHDRANQVFLLVVAQLAAPVPEEIDL